MSAHSTDQASRRRPARRLLSAFLSWRALALVVAVGLLAVAAERGFAWRQLEDREDGGAAAVEVASEEVLGLISISGEESSKRIDELLENATAGFREELEAQATRLQSELQANQVEATGEIMSAGLTTLDADSATVIVAARGTVTNTQATTPEPRNYRLQVVLERDGERWLVSGLEFVA